MAVAAALVMFACGGDGAQVAGSSSSGSRFDSGRAWEHLRRQVAIGPRPAGSAESQATRRYLIEQLRAAGIEAHERAFDASTPIGLVSMANVVATIPGARPERIALASHYDTKLSPEFRFVGASDGASSTAAVLELGRVLKGRKNPFTIELIFFDGEESVEWEWKGDDNRYGSRHYVEQAVADGSLAGLKALILLDLIGDRNLNIRREASSTRWLNDILWASAGRLGHGAHFQPAQVSIDDDHVIFIKAGVPAVDLIDMDFPAWHTADDDLDAVSPRSLQIVGDVVLDALPHIEKHLAGQTQR